MIFCRELQGYATYNRGLTERVRYLNSVYLLDGVVLERGDVVERLRC